MKMFCFQCQEANKNIACKVGGVCGKKPELSNMMDLLLYVCKGLSVWSVHAKSQQLKTPDIDKFITKALFITITNANFDKVRIKNQITQGLTLRKMLIFKMKNVGITPPETLPEASVWSANATEFDKKANSKDIGVLTTDNDDVRSLRELLIYGIKGIAAYAEHSHVLGYDNDEIYDFMQKGLAATLDDSLTSDELFDLVVECGKTGVDVMTLLDKANTTSYGNPEISKVNIGVRNNPAILISGHDLKDMEILLRQTEGTGVDVYTHCEMLPANYYPAFKKYSHFVGNYGNSWWLQKAEFEKFNGPVLLTTNCLVPPKKSYIERVYTTGTVGFEGVKHIQTPENGKEKDFSPLIEHAKKCPPPIELETGEIVGGFAHNQVINLADKIVEAVKSGAIKRFFVMAGCDGRMKNREYYTEFAEALPKDTVILTAGCAKYRYNKLPLGDIDGIPRVLDAGQCNDSYSLAVIAMKLKEVFELNDINELPISYNIAWYEQKAVIVLLALLYLGVKNIHLGPTLPAFLSPNIANILVEKFGIAPIQSVSEDLKTFGIV